MKDSPIKTSRIQKYIVYSFLVIAMFVFISQTYNNFKEKSEYRGYYHGDLFSEIGSYAAGINFARWGFAKLYFLPVFTVKDTPNISKEEIYTHYAPGADLMSGFFTCIGITGLYTQKFVLLLVSIVAIIIFSSSIKYIVNDNTNPWMPSLIFLSLVLTSPWFVYRADTIHINSYGDILLFLGVWAIVSNRMGIFVLICFFSMLFTYETIPFLFIMAFFKSLKGLFSKDWTKKRGIYFLLLVCFAFVSALAIHFLQVACMYGSVRSAFDEFIKAFCLRTSINGVSEYYFLMHITKFCYSTLWFYGSAVLFLAAVGFIRGIRSNSLWIYALLAAGVSWQFLFRQHSMVHGFTTRSLGLGIFSLAIVGFSKLFYSKKFWIKISSCILLSFALLRIPLGVEVSKNKLLLNAFSKAISKTDSVVIANLLYFTRDSLEHREEKRILINELAKRNGVDTDLDAYEFILDDKIFILEKLPKGYLFTSRNIPAELIPKLSDNDVSAYQAEFDIPSYTEKKQIVVKGDNRTIVFELLKIYMLLI